jgi:hypothetical protein
MAVGIDPVGELVMYTLLEPSEKVRAQLDLYAAQADPASWRGADRRAGMHIDLEAVISLGMSLYRFFKGLDRRVSEAVQAGEYELTEGDARRVAGWYADWLTPCDSLLATVAETESRSRKVAGAEEFRDACRDVRAILSVPLDRILAATQHLRAGAARPMGDIRDELRGRLLARGG